MFSKSAERNDCWTQYVDLHSDGRFYPEIQKVIAYNFFNGYWKIMKQFQYLIFRLVLDGTVFEHSSEGGRIARSRSISFIIPARSQ